MNLRGKKGGLFDSSCVGDFEVVFGSLEGGEWNVIKTRGLGKTCE